MDQEQLKQKIAEYYGKLPKEAQVVFSSMTWMETLKSISAKYGLNNNQIEILGTETTLVLLGIISIDEYEEILKKELMLEEEVLGEMMSEIYENILKKIETQLYETFDLNTTALVEEKTNNGVKLDEHFINLPKEVQEAIVKSGWKEKLYEMAQKYKINIEQMGILEEVTIKLMLNEIHPDQYESELASKITIPKEDISNLVKDVNEEILKKIREEEKKITNDELRITNEDEIPLPPYAKTITNDELRITNEETGKTLITNKKEEPKNIIEEKLKNPTVSERIVSDHSIPKISDPYREQF